MSSSQKNSPQSALRVEAVKTVQGPAATAISVEVDRQKLVDAPAPVPTPRSAVARVPVVEHGRKAVKEEELLKAGTRTTADRHVVDTFAKTVSTPVEANDAAFDVGVRLENETVWAGHDGQAQPAVHGADHAAPRGTEAPADEVSAAPSLLPLVGFVGVTVLTGFLGWHAYRAVANARLRRRRLGLARRF